MSENYYNQEIKNIQLDDEDNFDSKLAQKQVNSGFVSSEYSYPSDEDYD